jgi:hypothetical protein
VVLVVCADELPKSNSEKYGTCTWCGIFCYDKKHKEVKDAADVTHYFCIDCYEQMRKWFCRKKKE